MLNSSELRASYCLWWFIFLEVILQVSPCLTLCQKFLLFDQTLLNWVDLLCFIQSFVDRLSCCCCLMYIGNNAAVKVCIQISTQESVFASVWFLSRSALTAYSVYNGIFAEISEMGHNFLIVLPAHESFLLLFT